LLDCRFLVILRPFAFKRSYFFQGFVLTDSRKLSDLGWFARRAALAKAVRADEWDVPEGTIGGLIRQHRMRARKAIARTRLLMASLFITIALGLAYYLGLPLWEQYLQIQGRSDFAAAQARVEEAEKAMAALDAERDQAWSAFIDVVAFRGEPASAGGGELFRSVALVDTPGVLVAVGDEGAVARSTDGGLNWTVQHIDDGPRLRAVVVFSGVPSMAERPGVVPPASEGRMLYAVGSLNGAGVIYQSADDGGRWSRVPLTGGTDWWDAAVDPRSAAIMVVGTGASFAYKRGISGEWAVRPSFKGTDAIKVKPDAANPGFVVLTRDGDLLRLGPAGENRQRIYTGIDGAVDLVFDRPREMPLIVDAKATIWEYINGSWANKSSLAAARVTGRAMVASRDAFGIESGTIVMGQIQGGIGFFDTGTARLRDTHVATTGDTYDVVQLPNGAFVAVGHRLLARVDDRFSDEMRQLEVLPGVVGDAVIRNDGLRIVPDLVMQVFAVSQVFRRLDAVLNRRPPVVNALISAEADRDRIRLSGFQAAEDEERLRAFLALCRGDAPPGEGLTKTCIDAFVAREAALAPTVWQIVTERAPPAVLLIFLLATLGALYRYTIRIAGFYQSRADMLALIAMKLPKTQVGQFALFVDALAADKVEFGKEKLPTDHAIDLARTILNRS
jgi:hypothetical protein